MTIEKLQKLMVDHGLTIRAIPVKIKHVYEVSHSDRFSDAEVVYMDEYKRKMLVYYTYPKNGGKFIIISNCGNGSMVSFISKKYYDSIEDALVSLEYLEE